MRLKLLKRIRYVVFSLVSLTGLGSTVASIIISVKYLDAKVPWQCILGAFWTIASLIIFICGLIGLYNTLYMNENPQKKEYYDKNGNKKIFKYKEEYIKLNDLKDFLVNTKTPEKIYILTETNTFSVLKVDMEYNRFTRKHIYDTKEFILDDIRYKNIDDITDLLCNNYLSNDDCICVIGYKHAKPLYGRYYDYPMQLLLYEHHSPYYLKKRIDEKEY